MIKFATGIAPLHMIVLVRINKTIKLINYKEMYNDGKLEEIRKDIFYAARAML